MQVFSKKVLSPFKQFSDKMFACKRLVFLQITKQKKLAHYSEVTICLHVTWRITTPVYEKETFWDEAYVF